MSTHTMSPSRTWRIPKPPLEDWSFIALMGWGAMLLGMVASGLAIDHWSWIAGLFGRDVNDVSVNFSIWMPISGVSVWFVGFASGYFMHYILPAFVAGGRTRQDSAIEAAIFGTVLAIGASVLVTIGYGLERMVYAVAEWNRGTPSGDFLDSYNDYGVILMTNLSMSLMTAAGGAMIGSSFYRSHLRGFLSVAVALLAVNIVGSQVGDNGPFIFLASAMHLDLNLAMAVLLQVVAGVLMAGIAWWNVRDLPLRKK